MGHLRGNIDGSRVATMKLNSKHHRSRNAENELIVPLIQ